MLPKVIELRPNRSLLDPNFNGYKLSLEQIEFTQEQLEVPVDRILPNYDQYSLLHAKLFGMHNHLTGETLNNKASVYFVNEDWHVQKAYVDEITGTISDLVEVWRIPKHNKSRTRDYNISLKFASEAVAVMSDGTGIMHILNTGERGDDSYWEVLFSDEIIEPGKGFLIQDVLQMNPENSEPLLHSLLVSIEQDDKQNERHCTILRWVTLSKNKENSWAVIALRELKCKGTVHYAVFEPNCSAFYSISDNGVEFTLDSENPLMETTGSQSPPKKIYMWIQSKEDIVLKFRIPDDFSKDHLLVSIKPTEIQLSYKDTNLICGKLYGRINADLMTWITDNGVLSITLIKSDVDLMWPEVVEGDQTGEHIVDPSVADEIHQRLAHLCSDTEVTSQECSGGTTLNSQQMEECDFEDEKVSVFERVSLSHEVTHKANIGSHGILLTVKLDEDLPPAFATRHDVDGCIWQPGISDDTLLKHVGTLLAFGYVQASKQQRKFSKCAPDLSYSIICESSKHIFVYRQYKSVTSGRLRNRVTGQNVDKIAQQQLISLPKNEEVLGIYAVNSTLFVLTEKAIMAFKM